MTRMKAYRSVLTRTMVLGLLAALMAMGLMLAAQPTRAQTNFTVTRSDDSGDPNPGDGECGFLAGRGGQVCTLRSAIQEANATPGADTINFNIDGGEGVKTISPTSALPSITEAVTINGYSQLGSSPTLWPRAQTLTSS